MVSIAGHLVMAYEERGAATATKREGFTAWAIIYIRSIFSSEVINTFNCNTHKELTREKCYLKLSTSSLI